VNRSVSCSCPACPMLGAVQDQILSDDHVEPEPGDRDRRLSVEPPADSAPTPLPLVADPDVHSEDEVPDTSLPKRDIDDRA
jgi:hypothetical protein